MADGDSNAYSLPIMPAAVDLVIDPPWAKFLECPGWCVADLYHNHGIILLCSSHTLPRLGDRDLIHLCPSTLMPCVIGRMRVSAIAVPIPNLAIRPVNDHLSLVSLCSCSGCIDSLPLCFMRRRDASITWLANCPASVVRHDVAVVTLSHNWFLLIS
jgi:hypothetical protein